MRNIVKGAIFLILSMGLLSCSIVNQKPIFQVTPLDVSPKEALEYNPFMKNAGAVKVRYRGDKDSIRLLMEVWVDGELYDVHSQMGGFLTEDIGNGLKAWDGEVLISIEINETDDGHSRYTTESIFFDESGHISYEGSIDADEAHTSLGHIQLHERQRVSDEGEVAIWGIQASDRDSLTSVSLVPEELKQTDWALVFKLAATESD